MQRSSILDRIKSQIPTIDSDVSSSSDNEEDISVYRRPSVFRLPQGAEVDLDYLSLEEPGIEDLLKSVTEPFTYGNDDDCCDQKDDIVSLPPKELDDCKTLVATSHDFVNAAETESLCSESAELSKSLLHESNSDMITAKESTSPESTNSERERFLQTPAREICRKQSLESMHAQTYPILSLKPLENWDLDQVLQSLKHHTGYHKVENEKGEPQLFQPFKYTDYVNERPEVNVMEQLAAFCKKQASKKVAPMAISSTVESHELQRPYISSPAIIRNDGWTDACNNFEENLHRKNCSSQTVCIDLRNTEHQTKPAVTCDTSSCPDLLKQVLSTEMGVNTQLDAAKRNGMLTGKSLLLQKIRESSRTRAEYSVQRKTPKDPVKTPQEEILRIKEV